jgi:biopolymer transport protein ExbB
MITRIVYEKLQTGSGEEAYDAIQKYKGSIARVIRATLRNITRDREHIEDIITENILNENRSLDRFSNFILVVAAVSPLLGLLGTVTGMIQTFDIISVYGTGDPKLLSSGISEALITTMLGLIIAIPLLLLGNLSRGWADNIKDDMEQSALHVVNLFEKYQKND